MYFVYDLISNKCDGYDVFDCWCIFQSALLR